MGKEDVNGWMGHSIMENGWTTKEVVKENLKCSTVTITLEVG